MKYLTTLKIYSSISLRCLHLRIVSLQKSVHEVCSFDKIKQGIRTKYNELCSIETKTS